MLLWFVGRVGITPPFLYNFSPFFPYFKFPGCANSFQPANLGGHVMEDPHGVDFSTKITLFKLSNYQKHQTFYQQHHSYNHTCGPHFPPLAPFYFCLHYRAVLNCLTLLVARMLLGHAHQIPQRAGIKSANFKLTHYSVELEF